MLRILLITSLFIVGTFALVDMNAFLCNLRKQADPERATQNCLLLDTTQHSNPMAQILERLTALEQEKARRDACYNTVPPWRYVAMAECLKGNPNYADFDIPHGQGFTGPSGPENVYDIPPEFYGTDSSIPSRRY